MYVAEWNADRELRIELGVTTVFENLRAPDLEAVKINDGLPDDGGHVSKRARARSGGLPQAGRLRKGPTRRTCLPA